MKIDYTAVHINCVVVASLFSEFEVMFIQFSLYYGTTLNFFLMRKHSSSVIIKI